MLCGSHMAGSSAGRFRGERRHFPRLKIDPEGFPDEKKATGFRAITDFRRKPAMKQVSSFTQFSMTTVARLLFQTQYGDMSKLFCMSGMALST